MFQISNKNRAYHCRTLLTAILCFLILPCCLYGQDEEVAPAPANQPLPADLDVAPAIEAILPAVNAAPAFMAPAWGGTQSPEDEMKIVESVYVEQANVRIAELHRVCDLSENQRKKLDIATKGSIAKLMEKEAEIREQYQEQFQGNMGFQVINAPMWPVAEDEGLEEIAEPDEDEDEEIAEVEDEGEAIAEVENEAEEIEEAQFIDAPAIVTVSLGTYPVSGATIENEDVWKTAVERTLTDEQKTKYENHLGERREFRRRSAVSSFISNVDAVLLMSTDQREQLTTLVGGKFGEQLVRNSNPAAGAMPGVFVQNDFIAAEVNAEETEDVDYEKFRDDIANILDESQLKTWDQQFAYQLTMQWDAGAGGIMPVFPQQNFAPPMLAPAMPLFPAEVMEPDDPAIDR